MLVWRFVDVLVNTTPFRLPSAREALLDGEEGLQVSRLRLRLGTPQSKKTSFSFFLPHHAKSPSSLSFCASQPSQRDGFTVRIHIHVS